MVVRKAYNFRIYPTQAQETLLNQTLETCREVYNSLLYWRKYDYERFKTSPSYQDQQNALPRWKQDHPHLREVHSQVLQNVCRRVQLAYDSYFDRLADYQQRKEQGRLRIVNNELEKCPGPPRPKGSGSYDSLTYTQAGGFTLGKGCIGFSKLATIKAVLHREIPGVMKTATIRRQSGKWFVVISCIEEVEPLPASSAKVKNQHQSQRRRKAKKVVTRVHERIRNKRHNFHHTEARKIVNRCGVITVEKLNIANMSKSPAPKQDDLTGIYLPNGHAAKAGLNQSILDAGWYSFRMILTSKAESAGRDIYEINPAFTSQDCAGCGYRPPKKERKKLSDRWHDCPKCGYSVHRDKNSAVLQDKIGMGLHTVRRRAVEAPAFTPGE